MISCESIRGEFPELSKGLVFLDSAASSLKPFRVIDAMSSFIREKYANVHRGIYFEAAESTRLYDDAHETVGKLICAKSGEVIFTPQGTTTAIQLAALLLEHNGMIERGSQIIVPMDAHNSNLIPWIQVAKRTGANLRLVPLDKRGVPRWDLLDEMLEEPTSLVTITHVSNVTGYESPVREIARKAKKHGAIVLVDGAQSVPHIPVCVDSLGADFLAFSGHKMLGPTGIGVLWARRDLLEQLEPPLGGGGTVADVRVVSSRLELDWESIPLRFESGTPPIVEAVGLAEAARMLMEIGMENVKEHEHRLVKMTLEEMQNLRSVSVIGPLNPEERRGVISFTLGNLPPDLVAGLLAQRRIAVRSGKHCAHVLHNTLGYSQGSVRASLYIYNCPKDIRALVDTLRDIERRAM